MIKVGITKMLKSTTMRILKKVAMVKNESQDYRIGGGAVASDGLADWRCLSRWWRKLVIIILIILIHSSTSLFSPFYRYGPQYWMTHKIILVREI